MSFEPIADVAPAMIGMRLRGTAARWLGMAWRYLRAVSGDDAYERYLAHHASEHPGEPTMTRKAFFSDSQRQKWTGVTRCC